MIGNVKRGIKVFSWLVLILTFLCLYGFLVRHVMTDGKKLGIFTQPLLVFVNFPNIVAEVLTSDELRGIPPSYITKDLAFEQRTVLDYDVYGLNSFFNNSGNVWEVKLFNFKNDSIIHTWRLRKENYIKGELEYRNSQPKDCILLPDRSIIVAHTESKNLYKFDRESNIIWHNKDKNYHHSLNPDADGNIWICTSEDKGIRVGRGDSTIYSYYKDNGITKIDGETGKLLFDKSISDILVENGLKHILFGYANEFLPNQGLDPLHLNDIEPVLEDGPFWKKDDLFISLRQRSMVLLYRPSTNKILRIIDGPFLNQHDVDIISETEISIFNNNTTLIGNENSNQYGRNIVAETYLAFETSGIVIYDFKDSTFSNVFDNQFISEEIFTQTEGVHQFLSTGDVYVESQNEGKVYILNDDEILLKKQFDTDIRNTVYLPNWIRIYEHVNF